MRQRHVPTLLCAAMLGAGLLFAPMSHAATFHVTTLDDAGTGSLREAILAANANAGADIIEFDVTGTLLLESPLPIVSESLELRGPGMTDLVIDANQDQRHFRFGGVAGSVYRIADLTLRNGNSSDVGGSIMVLANASLTVERSIIEDNRADSDGGGIAAYGPVEIFDSIIRANLGSFGGGVYLSGAGHRILRSAILLNNAEQGGGIYVGAGAELEVENSTLAGNLASNDTAGGFGGAIQVAAGLTAISHVTISDNVADSGGGIALTGGLLTTFANNILTSNWTLDDQPSNCLGNLPDDFANLSSDHTCQLFGDSDLENTDPRLGALADNGGATPSMLPKPGSPVIDSALTGFCAASDQRDLPRPETGGSHCDRGALEVYPDIDHDFVIFRNGFE